jgi:hypothetical protein
MKEATDASITRASAGAARSAGATATACPSRSTWTTYGTNFDWLPMWMMPPTPASAINSDRMPITCQVWRDDTTPPTWSFQVRRAAR